jgi:signal transduction histidine kinase
MSGGADRLTAQIWARAARGWARAARVYAGVSAWAMPKCGRTWVSPVRVTAGIWAATALMALAGAALTVLAWRDLTFGDALANLGGAVAAVVYATLGSLIVRRVGNRIGWILLGEGAAMAVMTFASGYAVLGIATHPGALPAAALTGLLAEWVFVPVLIAFSASLLFFPSGRLPSPRWRPVAGLGLVATAPALIGLAIEPRLIGLPAPGGVSLRIQNPLGVTSLGPVLPHLVIGTLAGLAVLIPVLLVAPMVSLAVRYRAGGRESRQQIKWVAFTTAAALTSQLVAAVFAPAWGGSSMAVTVANSVMAVIALLGMPAAITVAILKHGLYEIDVIINRTVVYGLLSASLTAVYAGIVVGFGTLIGDRGGPPLTIGAAAAVALLFQPLRRRAQQLANRLVFGQRATPYQVLSDFAKDMAGQLSLDEALDRMVSLLAGAVGAAGIQVWIRVGAELRPVATWPRESSPPAAVSLGSFSAAAPHGSAEPAAVPLADGLELPPFGPATHAVAVRHGGELLGALALQKPRSEPLSMAEDKLIQHLASQAGLVLRNVRLTTELRAMIDELRASRRRLVEAQDEERRKIERNLHDGAQQQLIALTVLLRLLEDSAGDPAAVRQMARDLKSTLHAALDDLRNLAHGIYPPLLADQGLAAALEAQARKAPLPVLVEADGVGRCPQEAEAAVYFCALEALQNISKYAAASRATVCLSCSGGSLHFSVADDGAGFDTAQARRGSGLQGMADRLAALGGTMDIRSQPGTGTTVVGQLPLPRPSS